MYEYRTTEVFKNEKWNKIDFHNLKEFDVFRLFEPDGKPVIDCKGKYIFVATSDIYQNGDIDTINYQTVDLK